MRKRPSRPLPPEDFGVGLEALDRNALDTPERIVQYCRDKGLFDGDALDIEQLIRENENISLVFSDLGSNDAYLRKLDDGRYELGINSRHPKTRQRFSMAHEYAHYQMHRDKLDQIQDGEKILFRSDERNTVEYQANRFAAEILMPEEEMRNMIGEMSLNEIASAFSVSELAAEMRSRFLSGE